MGSRSKPGIPDLSRKADIYQIQNEIIT